ncbi:MAG TPA: hypothetical protein ENK20_09085 [Chromatiales bacterium]|nr:hypothetical protein [Chromatiales bacterium]
MRQERWDLVDDALVEVVIAADGPCFMRTTSEGVETSGAWRDRGAAAVVLGEHLAERGLVLSWLKATVAGDGNERVKVTLAVRRGSATVVRFPARP